MAGLGQAGEFQSNPEKQGFAPRFDEVLRALPGASGNHWGAQIPDFSGTASGGSLRHPDERQDP
jgi:hypothetical protein